MASRSTDHIHQARAELRLWFLMFLGMISSLWKRYLSGYCSKSKEAPFWLEQRFSVASLRPSPGIFCRCGAVFANCAARRSAPVYNGGETAKRAVLVFENVEYCVELYPFQVVAKFWS